MVDKTLFFSARKEHFINKIKEMNVDVQELLGKHNQEITENADNVDAFQDLAECTKE